MHITVRMAWHDNNWNGTVCRDPEGTNYCPGAHSILSGRIEKNKDPKLEAKYANDAISRNGELGSSCKR